jgi:hypothetical protein
MGDLSRAYGETSLPAKVEANTQINLVCACYDHADQC